MFLATLEHEGTPIDYYFIAQSGGMYNSRKNGSVGIPAHSSEVGGSHEFSSIIDVLGMLLKTAGGSMKRNRRLKDSKTTKAPKATNAGKTVKHGKSDSMSEPESTDELEPKDPNPTEEPTEEPTEKPTEKPIESFAISAHDGAAKRAAKRAADDYKTSYESASNGFHAYTYNGISYHHHPDNDENAVFDKDDPSIPSQQYHPFDCDDPIFLHSCWDHQHFFTITIADTIARIIMARTIIALSIMRCSVVIACTTTSPSHTLIHQHCMHHHNTKLLIM